MSKNQVAGSKYSVFQLPTISEHRFKQVIKQVGNQILPCEYIFNYQGDGFKLVYQKSGVLGNEAFDSNPERIFKQ